VPRPRLHDDNLRQRLLKRAAERLSAHGPEALGLRRLATEVGTSTTAVYSLFGGKPGLLRELYVEGFRRLGDRMEQIPTTDDPESDLVAMGHAYRHSALANHNFYSIMFNNVVPDFEPDADAQWYALRSIAPLEEAVRRALREGVLVAKSEQELVFTAWALVHGLVSLELNGSVPSDPQAAEDRYDRAVRGTIAGWRPGNS